MKTASKNGKTTTKNRIAAINEKPDGRLLIKPLVRRKVSLRIRGTSPLITHNWDEKSLRMMREKHAGRRTKDRDPRDPEAEGKAACYFTDEGKLGMNALAIKAALSNAAHKDLGIAKTLVNKSVFVMCKDSRRVLPLIIDTEPVIQEDTVRVGQGSTDLRYRPYYYNWAMDLEFEIDAELMRVEDLVALIERAGFGVGIGEWRPENGGEFGRFCIDPSVQVKHEEL